VQAAREAARRTQCSNQIKQLALGALSHEQANGCLPTGGWGLVWVGDADRGYGRRQPGGFVYNILPYAEQPDLHDLGVGAASDADGINCCKQRMATPLPTVVCPSRRTNALVPQVWVTTYHYRSSSFTPLPTVGKLDYAGNAGTTNDGDGMYGGPGTLAEGDGMSNSSWLAAQHAQDTGVIYTHSATAMADITDGVSNTYMLGEKWCDPDHYSDGMSQSDDQGWDAPADWDSLRFTGITTDTSFTATNYLPMMDTPGYGQRGCFGSAHSGGFYMGFCDGSVQFMNYNIDAKTHSCLGRRNDEVPIDPKKLN
jgi:prepilin-type processing-associated H-X9-DG protein